MRGRQATGQGISRCIQRGTFENLLLLSFSLVGCIVLLGCGRVEGIPTVTRQISLL